ncbi:T9SS type A sorting domain-containing protein [Flavobacterium paronense]|uniref:T9SS type A sorting domain-containing protein n=1 Tax=Flavobacterium paronense TaxID=1392775 RepID=A0ABV5GHH8_9FLAO|nr:T9SS type A sorting domain-containing protein [Flavobacterium paronense]MDN3676430.1 T9SS type A sorting domain-containing protein [Flavobacterium paronense]
MKKTLLIIALGFTFLTANAQVISTDNFDNYTLFYLTPDITGTASHQGYWLGWVTPNIGYDIDSFISTSYGNPSKGIEIEGFSNQYEPASKYLWKRYFPQLWNTRTSGNNTVEFQIDYIRPTIVRGTDDIQIMILDSSLSKVLAGFSFNEFGLITGRAYSYSTSNNTFGNFYYNLDDNFSTQLPVNIWMTLVLRFNKDTGDITFIIKNPNGSIFRQKTITGSGAGLDPAEIDFAIFADTTGSPNRLRADFDNYKVTALSSALAIDEVADESGFSVYPNPTTTEISISNKNGKGISSVVLTDINGRTVKQNTFDNSPSIQLNIADLSSGVYLMKIVSQEGTATKKIIKN